jgi:hypothetical protein
MSGRPDEPLRAAEEELWIERVLGISLTMLVVIGVGMAAIVVALILLLS